MITMNEEEAKQHIEMFVRNKIREGYRGLFPKRNARKNVTRAWERFNDKGANLEACTALGGVGKATVLVYMATERILTFEGELKPVLSGDYTGSHEDMLNEIRKD